ncbi:MAG: hypothetical protein A2252_00085 [Elusimicrobia bacterium RIFOXYA2_FULL_39_19]|nr:MAG: hypothetical protein A2252_00085 [Elusimicrobia bacterium RIFOXYA2_FULL_39_19]
MSDGTTICTQTENLSSGNDYPYSITGNATGIYVVGTDVSPGNMQWRIEKYVEQLSVPTTFVGTTLSAATINWSWINNSSIDELGYKIKTSTDGLIAFLSANTTYWSELGLLPNTQYTRYCNAYNQLVESGNSNSYSKYTFANSPTGLNSTAIYITSSTIQWTNAGATRYSVERAADNNGSPESYVAIKAWADNITGTTYADTGLSAETTYWYRMKSYNGDQIINSTPSNEISLLTLPLAPSVFYGSSQSTGSILWQWTDNSNYEKGFRVKTSTDGMIASLIPNATNWSEPYLLANTQYTRYVVTFNTTGESNKSASSATFSLASSPTGLISGAVYTTSATISWNNVGATRYAIERAPNAGGIPGVWSSIKTWADAITSNNFTDTALSGDTTFWYRIKSYNGNGMINTIPGNEIKIVTLPGPPSGFNGIALSSFSINWSWNDNSNSESGFRIYSSTDGIVGTVSANTTYFIEKNLSTNSQYTRYVIAYNASGNTGASNGDTKYTLANSSIVLNTVLVSISSVTLQWNSVGATRYAIERATDNVGVPGNWAMIKSWADNITGTICIDSNLAGGTTYWYRLKGYNVDGIINDTPSNEMKVYYPSAALDHYEVIAPSYILPNQLFTLTVNAKNESNMTVTNYSGNATIFSVLAENDTIIGSGQLSITSISLTNGAGVLYVETYNKSETIKIKIIDSNGKTGLSGVLNVVSSGTVLYTLTTNSNPLVGGTISPNPFGSVFPSSTSVQLTATPNPGYVFSVWSGDVSGNTNPITVIMNTNKTITAIFTAASSVTPSKIELTANPQSVIAGQSSNITCKVTDVYNNPVSGVPVTFSVTKGSGSVTVSSGNTDTNGQITTIFTHNLTQPGITVVRATAGSLTQDISISAAVLVTAGVQGIIAASEDPNTRVTIPANAISSNIKVTIILKNDLDSGELTMVNAANGKVAGKILPDVVRKFVALKQSDGTDYGNFAKPVTIEIPYTDSDNNGIVDGTQINVNKLKVLRLNETAQEWYLVQDGSLNQVDKVNKIVKCEVNHFSYYTLGNLSVAGDIDTVKPAQLHFGAANAVRKKINELKEKIDLSQ